MRAPAEGDSGLVAIEQIQAAAARLQGVAVTSRVVRSQLGSAGGPVNLKCECDQPVGSFKIRGAYNCISRLSPEQRQAGVITYSSGNHGQAVAHAAGMLGLPATVVMPNHAPTIKIDGVKRRGGTVVFGGPTSGTRREKAEEIAAQRGLTIVPPFDHPDVIAGQGTCTLEVLSQVPDIRTLLVPVGGGGLLAGACTVIAALRPEVTVVAVEPEGAAKLSAALAQGCPTPLQSATSIADGLLPLEIGSLTWRHIEPVLSGVVRVSDEEIRQAVRLLHETTGIRAEPSGAATVAALLKGAVEYPAETVAIISGGNVNDDLFDSMVNQ